jgi:hypothetical protein
MVCAVALLGTNHAKPYGPELQVKQMLERRLRRGENNEKENINIVECIRSLCRGINLYFF